MNRQQLRSLYSETQRRIRNEEITAAVNWIDDIIIDAASTGRIRCKIPIVSDPVLARDLNTIVAELQCRFPDVTFWISSSAAYLLIDWS